MYFLYILQSDVDGSFYVGSTGNLEQRFRQHNSGHSKATKAKIPWKIVYTETFPTRSDALKREYYIKRMKSRKFILDLIQSTEY